MKSDETDDSLIEALERLTVSEDDPTVIISETASSSSTGSSTTYKEHQIARRRSKLNEFLVACGNVQPIGQPKKPWEKMSMRAKKIHASKAGRTIVSALEVITPGDAGSLWQAVKESNVVEKALGLKEPSKYLQALAEVYENATGWDARRQILSVIVDLAPLKEIQRYIPGLTSYRFEMAKRHLIQHGRGVPIPPRRIYRVRIDETRLDHFLTFITSPHVVQDLPFGQRYLKLSNGHVLETPNVIRSMIPSRICDQYRQYCEETQVKPFSTSTMRRLLDVCAATTRKSLQGLDYLSADGAKAFDDLSEVVSKLENMGRNSDWVHQCEKSLKEAKQYIKTDYKVGTRTGSIVFIKLLIEVNKTKNQYL